MLLLTVMGMWPAPAAGAEPGRTVRLESLSDAPVDLAVAWAAYRFPCVSDSGEDCPTSAVLARDDDVADSLAAGGLRGSPISDEPERQRPLLLTDPQALSPQTRQELERYGPDVGVFIVGGDQAVSAAVEDELRNMGVVVTRIDGADRIQTAVKIADFHIQNYGPSGAGRSPTLLVRAYGTPDDPTAAFADALAAGSQAANFAAPVLLTATETLSPPTRSFLRYAQSPRGTIPPISDRVQAHGGPRALSDDVVGQVEELGLEVDRIVGADRAETAVRLLTGPRGLPDADDARGIALVEGYRDIAWADGLPAFGPVLLAGGTQLPAATREYLETSDDDETSLVCGPLVEQEACDEASTLLGRPPP